MLSMTRSSLAYITQAIPLCVPPRHLSCLPNWRVCIPPVGAEKIRRYSARSISTRDDTSVERSPLYETVPVVPIRPLACSTRVNETRRRNDELVSQIRTPSDVMGHWLLIEVIKRGRRQAGLPISRPASAAAVSVQHSHYRLLMASV